MGAIAKARKLRKALTPAEARLWLRLRTLRGGGLHFRRQHPERGYILDFVCLDRRLIVEVDGASHDTEDRARKDRVRDAVLGREGFVTLRFTNVEVRDEIERVVDSVRSACLALPTRSSLRADHPPLSGREIL
jgi:very-short-patch-repair endonuclease